MEVVFRRHDNADNNLVHAPIWQPLHQLREQAMFKRQSQSSEELDFETSEITEPQMPPLGTQQDVGEASFGAMDFPMVDLSCPQEFYSLFPPVNAGWE